MVLSGELPAGTQIREEAMAERSRMMALMAQSTSLRGVESRALAFMLCTIVVRNSS